MVKSTNKTTLDENQPPQAYMKINVNSKYTSPYNSSVS